MNYESAYIILDFANPISIIELSWVLIALSFHFWILLRVLLGRNSVPSFSKHFALISATAVVWLSFILTRFFLQHRSFIVLECWIGLLLTLVLCLQHIELLKQVPHLSMYLSNLKKYQILVVLAHFLTTIPCYIWPLGFESNSIMTQVPFSYQLSMVLYGIWLGIVLISNSICTTIAIKGILKIWKPVLIEPEAAVDYEYKSFNVMVVLGSLAFFDALALFGYTVSWLNTNLEPFERSALETISSSVIASHLALNSVANDNYRNHLVLIQRTDISQQ